MPINRFPMRCVVLSDLFARASRRLGWATVVICILILCHGRAGASDGPYLYEVVPGDSLRSIVWKFSGTADWPAVAAANRIADPDRIYPGETVHLAPIRPEAVLRDYLEAIYAGAFDKAYSRLTSDSRVRLPYAEFERALRSATRFDLESIRLCSDFRLDGRHIAQVSIALEEDPANWGFNVAWEENEWRVLVYDRFPAFPHYDGIIPWQCHMNP